MFKKTLTRWVNAKGVRVPAGTRGARKVVEQSRKWYAKVPRPGGGFRVVALASDKRASEEMQARLRRNAERLDAGIPTEDAKHDPSYDVAACLIDFGRAIRAAGNTPKHATQTERRAAAACAACGFHRLADLDAHKLALHLERRRRDERLSAGASNGVLTAVKMFGRWLVKDRRAVADPFASLRRVNAETDRRRVRRALSTDEVAALVAAADAGPVRQGLEGRTRGTVYALAAYLGLRRGEIAQLVGADVDLDGGKLTVRASVSKNRKLARLPIHDAVRGRLAALPRTGALFPGFGKLRTAAYMLPDLDAAGIDRDNAAGVVDLHSLRASLATNLARAGVPLAMARELLRHSTVELTAKAYTKLEGADLSAAVGRLPGLGAPVGETVPTVGKGSPTRRAGDKQTTAVVLVAPPVAPATDGKGKQGIARDDGKGRSSPQARGRRIGGTASVKTGKARRSKAGDRP